MDMFCYQCEQASKGTGCTGVGVCGKSPETAAFQDVLNQTALATAWYADCARRCGASEPAVDTFLLQALFTTVTNVNFDADSIREMLQQGGAMLEKARGLCTNCACDGKGTPQEAPAWVKAWEVKADAGDLLSQAAGISILKRVEGNATIAGLQELVLYGVKGAAAYAEHARVLGKEDEAIHAGMQAVLAALCAPDPSAEDLLGLALKIGEINLKVMEVLDDANTGTYGHPVPTEVRVTPKEGKAILVSGHDLKDLEELLKQTEGTGIQIYTHGEMLPAHGYPELKKYAHLAGNYGGAWQDQRSEFADFPGAVLMTTNCIQEPKDAYKDRIFTCGLVRWPGVAHISDRNFAPVIEAAKAANGFAVTAPEKKIMVGFGRNAVLGVADKVIEAVKAGAIRRFFLIGGCDGAKSGRNYYTNLAQSVPEDCVILTLACGKYRFNLDDFGTIGGIPRLLDIGQCNDAYSAIQIAVALAGAFDCGVNDLPLTLILSWYEQKAVAILLTLLHLGIRNIKLGPSLPAFLTPDVLNILVDKFAIAPISTPQEDLAAVLAPA